MDVAVEARDFSAKAFRKDLATILKDLASGELPVDLAATRIQEWQVPSKHHARELEDLLTRVAEEPRGPVRRKAFALAVALISGEVFDKALCINGVRAFFRDAYHALCGEVPSLPIIVGSELVPPLRKLLPQSVLAEMLPKDLQR